MMSDYVLLSSIEKVKKELILKAKKDGVYENFGQNEVRSLWDEYGYTVDVEAFDNWCMTYEDCKEDRK